MRRAGLLSSLLLTALLFYMMPGLLGSFVLTDSNRMDARLRPAESRTLTLWLIGGGMEDGRLISGLCSDFEKANQGIRIFLRRADGGDLAQPESVLPDAVLYTTGDIVTPEKWFLPIAAEAGAASFGLSAGQSRGVQYGLPLWLSPGVLSVPTRWFAPEAAPSPTPKPESFFGLQSPAPREAESAAPPDFAALPWRRLMEAGGLWIQPGVTWQQVLFACPAAIRGELTAACPPTDTAAPQGAARAWRLGAHLAAVKDGEALTALLLPPAVSQQTRFFSICRDGGDVRRLLRFLLSEAAGKKAAAAALLPLGEDVPEAEGLIGEAQRFYRDGMLLPNAFAHTAEELTALCRDGWLRAAEPVETLLKLR